MASQLSIYNGALRLLGERRLASLSEEREPRYLLDDVWDDNGVRACLEMGHWNFATRTQKIEYDPSIQPDFGYRYAFGKPTDWIRTTAVCADEYFNVPITRYEDEASYWFADYDLIYVRYVSDDVGYGLNYAKWPKSFSMLVESYFANEIVNILTHSDSAVQRVERALQKALRAAAGNDASNQPQKILPSGRWVSSRLGAGGVNYNNKNIPIV